MNVKSERQENNFLRCHSELPAAALASARACEESAVWCKASELAFLSQVSSHKTLANLGHLSVGAGIAAGGAIVYLMGAMTPGCN